MYHKIEFTALLAYALVHISSHPSNAKSTISCMYERVRLLAVQLFNGLRERFDGVKSICILFQFLTLSIRF